MKLYSGVHVGVGERPWGGWGGPLDDHRGHRHLGDVLQGPCLLLTPCVIVAHAHSHVDIGAVLLPTCSSSTSACNEAGYQAVGLPQSELITERPWEPRLVGPRAAQAMETVKTVNATLFFYVLQCALKCPHYPQLSKQKKAQWFDMGGVGVVDGWNLLQEKGGGSGRVWMRQTRIKSC